MLINLYRDRDKMKLGEPSMIERVESLMLGTKVRLSSAATDVSEFRTVWSHTLASSSTQDEKTPWNAQPAGPFLFFYFLSPLAPRHRHRACLLGSYQPV